MINAQTFYAQYRGHPLDDMGKIHDAARARGDACMFLAGDSTLDGKHWLYRLDKFDPRALYDRETTAMAAQQYVGLMSPPRAIKDVAFWLNRMAADEERRLTVLNLAVEESTLSQKKDGLNAVVSAAALLMTPTAFIDAEWAPGLSHFKQIFKNDIEDYLKKLTLKAVPATILVCMTYFPDENFACKGWASKALGTMGYDHFPGKLQLLIRKIYEISTMEVEISGARVIPVALFEALDGKNTEMYVERVEPSAQGGRALAQLLLEKLRA